MLAVDIEEQEALRAAERSTKGMVLWHAASNERRKAPNSPPGDRGGVTPPQLGIFNTRSDTEGIQFTNFVSGSVSIAARSESKNFKFQT